MAFTKPASAAFQVDVQDQHLGDIDIFKEAGGRCRALVKTVTVRVTDETLSIHFTESKNNSLINGIEILPGDAASSRRLARRDHTDDGAIRVAVASTVPVTDPIGRVWEADSGFVGGQVVNRGAIDVANTDFPELYRNERYGMAWSRDVRDGRYVVNLYFAETSDDSVSGPGLRCFTSRCREKN